MTRPRKCRRIFFEPEIRYFKPAGKPVCDLEEVNLTLDELEALRLSDLDELYQEEAAEKMNISRQTFGNIIKSAHKKVADSLINSKALKIEGGTVEKAGKSFICCRCRKEFLLAGGENKCPDCHKTGNQ